MPKRTGIPNVGRPRLAVSGFLSSTPPGSASHETTPHNAPPQSAMLIRAVRSAINHSPMGSAANAALMNAEDAATPRRIVVFSCGHTENRITDHGQDRFAIFV